MSDETPDPSEEGEDSNRLIQSLRDQLANQAGQSEAQTREITMLRAGVDLESPQGKLLLKGYDGDMTVEAVRELWKELTPHGASPPPVHAPDPEETQTPAANLSEEERTALQVEADLSGGTPPEADDFIGKHPGDKALDEFWDLVNKKGEPTETASAAYVGTMLQAARSGDKRAIWNPNEQG